MNFQCARTTVHEAVAQRLRCIVNVRGPITSVRPKRFLSFLREGVRDCSSQVHEADLVEDKDRRGETWLITFPEY